MCLAVVPGDCIDGRPRDPSRLDRTRDGVRVTSKSPSLFPRLFQRHPPLNPPYHHVQGTAQRVGPASSAGDLWPPAAGWDQGPYQWTPQYRSSQILLAELLHSFKLLDVCFRIHIIIPCCVLLHDWWSKSIHVVQIEGPCCWMAWWIISWRPTPPRQCTSSPQWGSHTIRWLTAHGFFCFVSNTV